MITIRRADERGHGDHGWLDSRHTFSFAGYHDPAHMGFRDLRVMNEDRVAPGKGFGAHPHRDMEIISYVLEGALAHADSLGHAAELRPGEVQRISAGTGIQHREFNPSDTDPVHFYQIWLLPDRAGHTPDYAQTSFSADGRQARWQVIVSPDGVDGSLPIHQDATISLADLMAGESIASAFGPGRYGWLQVLRGTVRLGEAKLAAGDGVAIAGESALELVGIDAAELMLFDLP